MNYWIRIAAIRKRDMELTKTEQTPESHAFLYKRTEEKLHNLEVMTMEVVESKSVNAKDKLAAMEFLLQIYEDEYSLFLYGPSQFLTRDISGSSIRAGTLGSFSTKNANHEKMPKDNSMQSSNF
ncbi:MAG TPA: hypothetical protein VF419_05260 [Nitrososphaeraceae archaeon]